MTEASRVPFARFLKETAAVDHGEVRAFLFWVNRWLALTRAGEDASTPAAVSRFIDQLGREEEPAHVQQAEEAIRLYSFFQQSTRTGPASATVGTSAQEWDALASEVTRIARLKRLSLRTERSYLGWLRRFQAFAEEPLPSALEPRHVEQFPRFFTRPRVRFK